MLHKSKLDYTLKVASNSLIHNFVILNLEHTEVVLSYKTGQAAVCKSICFVSLYVFLVVVHDTLNYDSTC